MSRISGVFCALATPLDSEGEIDLAALDRLIERVVAGGVAGICPVGSTGEGTRLTAPQRHLVVQRVGARVPSNMPVLPAPAPAPVAQVLGEIESFAELGCEGVLLAPPAGYVLSDKEVLKFYESTAQRSALPIIMYHFPALTRVSLSEHVAGQLAMHDTIVGLKDSGRDLEYTQAVVYATAHAPNFSVLTGSDTMLMATMLAGGHGAIIASANVAPSLGVALYEATTTGDWPRARTLQQRLFEVVRAARSAGFPKGWKAALAMQGICESYPSPPATPLDGEALAALRRTLRELEVV